MVSDLKTFAPKGCEIAALQKVFTGFFVCSLGLNVFLPPLSKVQCPNFLDFWNPWGKLMERSGLRLENFCSLNLLNDVWPSKQSSVVWADASHVAIKKICPTIKISYKGLNVRYIQIYKKLIVYVKVVFLVLFLTQIL